MIKEVELSLFDIVGSKLCVASDDGQKVHDRISEELRGGKKVCLSFKEVGDLTSAFLNSAVGQLYGEFSEEDIRAKLSVKDVSQDDLIILKRVVDRAKEFFKDPDRFNSATNEVLGEEDD